MCIIDDPILALIARLVVNDIDNLSISDESFLKSQFAKINSHVENAPKEEQQKLAMSWIKEHAERYHRKWQRKTLSRYVVDKRCQDPPLIHDNEKNFCAIHSKWVILLTEYVSDNINSDKYIEDKLDILAQHRSELKISGLIHR